jgi:hypothetical protein
MPPTGTKSSSKSGPTKYRYIGDHAEILEGGQPVGPGDYVDLSSDDITGVNQALLNDGKLIDAGDYTPDTAAAEATAEEPAKEE